MIASMQRRRINSDFERTQELTKVEREPLGSRETRSESHRESTTSSINDETEILEEISSDTEDVFEN